MKRTLVLSLAFLTVSYAPARRRAPFPGSHGRSALRFFAFSGPQRPAITPGAGWL